MRAPTGWPDPDVTVMVALALLDGSEASVAVTTACPTLIAVTRPASLTVATVSALLVQEAALPPAPLTVSCTLSPTAKLAAPGVTLNDGTPPPPPHATSPNVARHARSVRITNRRISGVER